MLKRQLLSLAALLTLGIYAHSTNPIIGRWDITIHKNGTQAPSWLEVKLSGIKTLVGSFVSESGSARPISEINFDNNAFSFSIPPQWDSEPHPLILQGILNDTSISGTITYPNGTQYNWTGSKAPFLKREETPTWGAPIQLFNGKNLSGWEPAETHSQWIVKNGILTSPQPGVNIISLQKFEDFKLHIEFRYPKNGNSGVYLRGRYEVQIADSHPSEHPSNIMFSSVYGFLTPSHIHSKGPGQWQSYDITLIGRMVTVIANGKTVICNQEIPGITGGAINSHEEQPGPLLLQGDHAPIEFRNITITPAKK